MEAPVSSSKSMIPLHAGTSLNERMNDVRAAFRSFGTETINQFVRVCVSVCNFTEMTSLTYRTSIFLDAHVTYLGDSRAVDDAFIFRQTRNFHFGHAALIATARAALYC